MKSGACVTSASRGPANILTLSFALTRRKWGKPQKTIPSRFLYEMTGQAETFPPQTAEENHATPKKAASIARTRLRR